jgi:hypothetical protein
MIYRGLVVVGNILTVAGSAGLLLGASGLISTELFAVGISSGVRTLASVAIAGCLLSAMGYGVADYLEK